MFENEVEGGILTTGGAQVIIQVTGSQEGNRAPLQGSTGRLGGVGGVGYAASGSQAINAETLCHHRHYQELASATHTNS